MIQVIFMEQSLLLSQDGLKISCKLSEPEDVIRRVVLGVHGFGGSSKDVIQTGLAEEMSLFSSATVRFDFPAHGESPLDSSFLTVDNCITSLLAAAKFAKETYPRVEDLCVFATGFGAYITLLALEQLQALPGRIKLVIQTPAIRMDKTLLSMLGLTPEELAARGSYTVQTERPFTVDLSFYQDLRGHSVLASYPMPMLILQGERDDYIRTSDLRFFRSLNDQARLVIIPGASHRFLEPGAWDMVLDLTRDWFEFEQVLLADWE